MSRLISSVINTKAVSKNPKIDYSAESFDNQMTRIDLAIERSERVEDTVDSLDIAEKSLESANAFLEEIENSGVDEKARAQFNGYFQQMIAHQLDDTPLAMEELSQEGIRERIRAIRNAAQDFVSNIRDDISSAFSDIEDAHQSLLERHSQLEARLANVDSSSVDEDEITVTGCNRVHFEGDYTPTAVSSGLNATAQVLSQAIERLVEDTANSRQLFQDQMQAKLEGEKEEDERAKNQREELVEEYRSFIEDLSTQSLSGGNRITSGRSRIDLRIKTDNDQESVSSSQQIDAGSLNRASDVLSASNTIVDSIEETIRQNRQIKESIEELVENYTQALTEGESEFVEKITESKIDKEVQRFFARALKQLARSQQFALRTANAGMDYAENMIEAMEK